MLVTVLTTSTNLPTVKTEAAAGGGACGDMGVLQSPVRWRLCLITMKHGERLSLKRTFAKIEVFYF